ncbi:MAG: hypothetical protein Kow0063_19760 [Anaerolineae bacterium]
MRDITENSRKPDEVADCLSAQVRGTPVPVAGQAQRKGDDPEVRRNGSGLPRVETGARGRYDPIINELMIRRILTALMVEE